MSNLYQLYHFFQPLYSFPLCSLAFLSFRHTFYITFIFLYPWPFQLTETSSRYARKISGTTALQEALKEKQQHIEQLLAERDMERAEMAKATSHICEVEKELSVLKSQHVQVRNRQGDDLLGKNSDMLLHKSISPVTYATINQL